MNTLQVKIPREGNRMAAEAGGANLWSVFPTLLWTALGAVCVAMFRKELALVLEQFSWRLKTGAAVKFFSVELGQSYVSPAGNKVDDESALAHRKDSDQRRWIQRQDYYVPNRRVMLVHRIAPSLRPQMLYDVQLYVVAHNGGSLACVMKVEYYLGRHWGDAVFTSIDRARGFPLSTSAYGPFMCSAELFFSDGTSVIVGRYVDFEMGAIGKPA